MRPKLWIVAGPNGAGKSTLVQAAPIDRLLPGVPFWNPDTLARQLLQSRGFAGFADAPLDDQRRAFLDAAEVVASMLDDCIRKCVPVGVETVLSSDKYRPLVEQTLDAGGFCGLIYVALRTPDLAVARVSQRVREGGHAVPPDKVHSRWQRSLANLGWFAARVSQFFVYDNSSDDPNQPPLLIAYGSQGTLRRYSSLAFPELAAALSAIPRTPSHPPE